MYPKYLFKTLLSLAFIFFFMGAVKGQTKGHLDGVLLNEQGKVLSGVAIELQPDHKRTVSNSEGKFSFKGLYGGVYVISVQALVYQKQIQYL